MTTLTAYAPSYAPWKGVFQRIAQADVFVFTDTDRYSPKDFHNRNRIITRNGPKWLTVPVLGGRDQEVRNVLIDGSQPWRRKHQETIRHAYGQEWEVLNSPWLGLANLGTASILWLMGQYNLTPRVGYASEVEGDETGSGRILALCKHYQADRYLCGEAGRNYLDLPAFKDAGVEVVIQPYEGEPVSALHNLFTEGPVL